MNKLPKSKVLINILLFIIFALFAVVQLNDPDPTHWVIIYTLVAIVPLTAIYVKIPKLIIWILFTGLLIYAGFYFNYFIDWLNIDRKEEIFGEMVYEKPYLEGTREFLGLILAALSLLFQLKK
jgi:Transmembrane family 220, helix